MLKPEIEEGNIEYKRYIKNYDKSNRHFYSLITQLNWRLHEGNGYCYYYIGVEDNGKIYGINDEEYNVSIKTLKMLCKECNAFISKITKKILDNNINYYIVKISNILLKKEYNENKILLIGDTGTSKTTFIAKLLKGTDNKDYIVNHKHEIESGKTSSINYYVLIKGNNKYLIFDSPGDENYHRTLMKIVHKIDYNLVIFFSGEEWEYYNYFHNYFLEKDTPIIKVNQDILNINRYDFINMIEENKKNMEYDYKNIYFNVLQTFYINEIGILVSGYLMSGCINVGDNLKYSTNNYSNHLNKFINIKIKSIHKSKDDNDMDISTKKINAGQIATLLIDGKELSFNKKLKYGYIYK
jgi:GTPase